MSEVRHQQAVEYLLGEMDESGHAAFEADCRIDPELALMVDELRPVVTRLETLPDEAWQPEPPPLLMPGSPPDHSPAPAVAPRPAPRFGFGWLRIGAGFAAALFILAAGVLVGLQLEADGPGETPVVEQTLALEPIGAEAPAAASGQVELTNSSEDAVTLDVSGLDPSSSKEFYELWLLGKEGELVALGTFRVEPGGDSRIELPLAVDPGDYEYFDVSIQSENGDPTHSGRSVLRGVSQA